MNIDELNIIKIISADKAQALKPSDGGKADGTFVISRDSEIVRTVDPASDDYSLVVCVTDGGELDLARDVAGEVVDPIVLVKSTGAQGGTSGGACDMGADLLATLAAIATRRRGR